MLFNKKRFLKKYAAIIFVAIFGLFFSIFSFLVIYSNEQQEYTRSSDLYAQSIIYEVETELNTALSVLDSFEAFYKSSEHIDREEFGEFSSVILSGKAAAKVLQWLPKVTSAEKQEFIDEARGTELKDFNFKKLDQNGNWQLDFDNAIYFPVYYTRPRITTSHLLGFDWNSIPERRQLLESIHDTNIHWCPFNDIEDLPGHTYPVVKAIYDAEARDFTNPAVNQHLLGFVVVLVSLDDLLHKVLAQAEFNGTEFHIYMQRGQGRAATYVEIASTESQSVDINKLKSSSKHFYSEPCIWASENFVLMVSPPKQPIDLMSIYPALFFSLAILALAFLLSLHLWKSMKKEEEIRKAVEERTLELKKSNEELDKFAYIASHDLKEPIRGIYTYANFLKEDYSDKLNPEANEMLDTIKDLCERLTGLVSSLLEFSRLGRVDFAYRITDINQVIKDVLTSIKLYLEENKAEIIIEGELPCLFCDSVRIGEVFRNLITNAVKYNKNPEKQVTIGCASSPELGRVFYVKDNGIGIDPKHFDDIFQIFRRLNPVSQFAEGTGVGLTLVKRIIERHGGKIWLESEKGKGTTFFFTLGHSGS